MRLDRLLSITIHLLSREKVTARELAERFEVSIRTIYRDMDALGQAGIPVISFPGQDGGFGILNTFKLDRQIFTVGDITAVLSSLQGLNRALHSEQLNTVIDKIRALVPSEKTHELEGALEQVVIDVMPWGMSKERLKQFQLLQGAVSRQHLIHFAYRSNEGVLSERIVEPLTLVFKSYAWYLWGWCRLREDYRLFRLSRIRNIRIHQESFVRRAGSYRDDQMITEPSADVNVVLRFPPARRIQAEEIFPTEDIRIEEKGSALVHTAFPDGEWIYGLLLSFGGDVEVLEPQAVRDELAARAKKIADLYQT